MCVKYETLPLALPLSVQRRADGLVIADVTLVLAKATSKHTGGDHYSRRGASFPLGRWVDDPLYQPGDHARCLHFAPPEAAWSGQLDSYGSHILLCLPSIALWSAGSRGARCFHDRATAPVLCLTCETGGKLPSWADLDLWRELRLPDDALPDGPAGLGLLRLDQLIGDVDDISRGVDLLLRHPRPDGPMWHRRVLLRP